MKNVQISEELFARICGYFILDQRDALQERLIKDGLEQKLEAIQRRADYTNRKSKSNG